MSKFQKLIEQALQVERELRTFEHKPKLTAAAFLRDAVRNAGTDDQRLDALEKKLASGRFRHAAGYVTRCARFAGPGDGIGNVPYPPADTAGLLNALATPEAHAELIELGSGLLEAFALGARQAVKQFPGSFGAIDDWEKYEARVRELRERRGKLLKEANGAWSVDDIDMGEVKSDSSALITFKLSAGMVPAGPIRDASERLVNYLLDHEAEREAA